MDTIDIAQTIYTDDFGQISGVEHVWWESFTVMNPDDNNWHEILYHTFIKSFNQYATMFADEYERDDEDECFHATLDLISTIKDNLRIYVKYLRFYKTKHDYWRVTTLVKFVYHTDTVHSEFMVPYNFGVSNQAFMRSNKAVKTPGINPIEVFCMLITLDARYSFDYSRGYDTELGDTKYVFECIQFEYLRRMRNMFNDSFEPIVNLMFTNASSYMSKEEIAEELSEFNAWVDRGYNKPVDELTMTMIASNIDYFVHTDGSGERFDRFLARNNLLFDSPFKNEYYNA